MIIYLKIFSRAVGNFTGGKCCEHFVYLSSFLIRVNSWHAIAAGVMY
jgi:hypothetical protein